MSILKKLAGETALYGLSSILGRLLTFVFLTPYLTRKFVPDQMGLQIDLYAWAAFLMVIFTYRMETALFRFGSKKENRFDAFRTASGAIFGSTLTLVLILVLLSQPIANFLEYPNHSAYIVCFAFILGFDALAAIPFALLRLQGKAMRFASIKLLNLFIHLGAILFFLEFCPFLAENEILGAQNWYNPDIGIAYIFIANLIASAITFALLLPTYFSERAEKGEEGFNTDLLKEMLVYAAPLVVAGFAGIINEVLDRTLLKMMLTGDLETRMAQVGIYGACYKISIFMNLFTQAFNYAAEPFFFKNQDREDSRKLYAGVAYLFALVGCFAFLGITLFMDIAQYFVGEDYREGLSIVPILLLANLCLGLYYNVAVWFKLSNQTKYGAYIALIGASVTLVLNLILIPMIGYMGSAWATLACYATMVVVAYAWGQKHYPIPYPIRKILSYFALAISLYLLFSAIKPSLGMHSLMGYLLSIFLLGIFAGIVWLSEQKTIAKLIKK